MPDGDVARYYDENTRGFLAHGHGGREGVLHRAVWGEGVRDPAGAFHFVHELILREIETLGAPCPRILDLGCGVGASLLYLLDRHPAEGFGITVSGEQYESARHHGRARWMKGDFCTDPLPAKLDLAYGIESFLHASDPAAFFGNVRRALRPEGRLVLVDDFLAKEAREEALVRDFVWGWHGGSLLRPDEADAMAAAAGFALVSDRDLTPNLSLDRPRDRALAVVLPLLRPFLADGPRLRSLVGGNALRACLERGLVAYRFRVWENRPEAWGPGRALS